MLNWSNVIKYVKNNMALPSGYIEKTDDELQEYLIENTLPEFSSYYPDKEYAPVIVDSTKYKHSLRNDTYYFFDDEDLPIYRIKDVYFSMSQTSMISHPVVGPVSMENMKWWSLSVFKSRFFYQYSDYMKIIKFIEPNIIKIIGNTGQSIDENFIVYYERQQPEDLRRIPNSLERDFKKLCLADIKIWIGTIRSHYGDGRINTPFGEIPLNGDTLKNEGREEYRELTDKFSENTMPSVIVDIY